MTWLYIVHFYPAYIRNKRRKADKRWEMNEGKDVIVDRGGLVIAT